MTRAHLVVSALAALVLSTPARAQVATPTDGPRLEVAAGDLSVTDLLERWAALEGKVLVVDPQVQPIRVRLTVDAALDARMLRHVLDMHDVVLVERDGVLEAHHRRNVNQKAGPPWDYVEGLAPRSDRLVTCVVPIRHGGGSSIFAVVRGLLTRDTNRISNILYVQGPEVLIIVDLGHNVRYYQEVIAALDRPGPLTERRVRLSVYEVDRGWWTKLQASERAPARLAAALAGAPADAATLLARSSLFGAEPASLERTTTLEGERLQLTLDVEPVTRTTGGDAKQTYVHPGDGLHVRLALELGPPGAGLRLLTRARFAAAEGSPAIQSYTGRAAPRATDVVVVIEQD
ncbi:MAG: hypothetical protein M9894_24085 [Planctomycetes bacterium]|nr:hypothetical protein [Planctomycetota bacterium]